MTENDLKNGQLFEFIEHKLRILRIEPDESDPRLTLKCIGGCCSKEFKIKMKLTLSDLEIMLSKKIIKKVSQKECILLNP